MAMTQQEIEQIAVAVAKKITPPVPIEVALWGNAQIAEYLGMSERHVAEHIVFYAGFPKPLHNISRSKQYRAIDVIKWRENPPKRNRLKIQGGDA